VSRSLSIGQTDLDKYPLVINKPDTSGILFSFPQEKKLRIIDSIRIENTLYALKLEKDVLTRDIILSIREAEIAKSNKIIKTQEEQVSLLKDKNFTLQYVNDDLTQINERLNLNINKTNKSKSRWRTAALVMGSVIVTSVTTFIILN
jgi:hypothetical protein